MSGIAEVMKNLGYTIQGSDAAENYTLDRLRKLGIKVTIGQAAANLGDAAVVVVSSAIKKDNPEMTQDVLDQAREKMREYGVVSGDKGAPIGAMTDERWKAFFDVASAQGVYPKTLDYKRAYTLQFVPK